MILGLRTAQSHVKPADLQAARDWYAKALGVQPYFDQPFYVGFNVGGFEFGLVPDEDLGGQAGSLFVYWGVMEIHSALEGLVAIGAKKLSEVEEVGEGIKKVSVLDPFGNRFGIIENPHFGT